MQFSIIGLVFFFVTSSLAGTIEFGAVFESYSDSAYEIVVKSPSDKLALIKSQGKNGTVYTLVFKNLQTIKTIIHGEVFEVPTTVGTGHGTTNNYSTSTKFVIDPNQFYFETIGEHEYLKNSSRIQLLVSDVHPRNGTPVFHPEDAPKFIAPTVNACGTVIFPDLDIAGIERLKEEYQAKEYTRRGLIPAKDRYSNTSIINPFSLRGGYMGTRINWVFSKKGPSTLADCLNAITHKLIGELPIVNFELDSEMAENFVRQPRKDKFSEAIGIETPIATIFKRRNSFIKFDANDDNVLITLARNNRVNSNLNKETYEQHLANGFIREEVIASIQLPKGEKISTGHLQEHNRPISGARRNTHVKRNHDVIQITTDKRNVYYLKMYFSRILRGKKGQDITVLNSHRKTFFEASTLAR